MKFAALLVAPVLAHNWMAEPPSRNGNVAATAKPCPAEAAGYVPLTVAPGATITASWTQNHGGDHYIRLVPAAEEATLEPFVPGAVGTAGIVAMQPNGVANTAPVTAPATAGTYTLQYVWNNYRNCATIIVDANGALTAGGNSTTMGAGEDAMLMANCATYCEDIMTQCMGDNMQYIDNRDCMRACATIPQTGTDGDSTGNTIQCRWYHLHVEKFDNAYLHCSHAGLEGGGAAHCGSGDFVPGVSLMIQITDPTALTAVMMKEMLVTALQEGGFIDCMSVGMPTLSTDADFQNFYTVQVTFLECPDGISHTETSPEMNAEALSSAEGSAAVLAYLQKSPMVMDGQILDYKITDASSASAAAVSIAVIGAALLA